MSTSAATVVPDAAERRVRRVVETYFERVNGRAFDELASLFTEDAVLSPPSTEAWRGRDRIARYYPLVLASFREHRDEPTRILVSGSTAIVEIAFEGTLVNGEPLSFDAVDIFDVAGDQIAALSIWYDTQLVFRKLTAALAVDGPSEQELERVGRFAESTPPRIRLALESVRRGVSFRLDQGVPAAYWRPPSSGIGLPNGGLVTRAVLADLDGGLEIQEALARHSVELRRGDALLVRTGDAGTEPLLIDEDATDWLHTLHLVGLATDAPAVESESGLELATGGLWRLDDLYADCVAEGSWDGLLVSVPLESEADRAPTSAVVLR